MDPTESIRKFAMFLVLTKDLNPWPLSHVIKGASKRMYNHLDGEYETIET